MLIIQFLKLSLVEKLYFVEYFMTLSYVYIRSKKFGCISRYDIYFILKSMCKTCEKLNFDVIYKKQLTQNHMQ